MTKDELAKIAEVIVRCNKQCPDNNKIIRLSQYDRPADMGPTLHINYLIIGDTLFIISAEERELFKRYLK